MLVISYSRLLIELGINKVTVTITVSKVLVLTELPGKTLTVLFYTVARQPLRTVVKKYLYMTSGE